MIDMLVVGALATAGLFLLHVPLPIALGILAGVLTFVPYLGAIMAGIPAVIVALTVGPSTVLWVIILYLICHTVEGYIVAPLVMRRTVKLPPALTVLSMTILGVIYGLFGVLIATPLTAAVMVLVREIYVVDMLGDRHSDEGSLVVMRRYAGPKFLARNRENRQS
jgi:predicted PurR-regulated permease PerM